MFYMQNVIPDAASSNIFSQACGVHNKNQVFVILTVNVPIYGLLLFEPIFVYYCVHENVRVRVKKGLN